MSETVFIKRPRYHPSTGVELHGDYEFDFPAHEDRLKINELEKIVFELKDDNHTLRVINRELKKKFDSFQKQINRFSKYMTSREFHSKFLWLVKEEYSALKLGMTGLDEARRRSKHKRESRKTKSRSKK